MFQVLRRPAGRPWARPEDWLPLSNADPVPATWPLALHMQENRSVLGQTERLTFAVLGTCFAMLSVLPALKGYWLVPVYSLGALGALVFALHRHQRATPRTELLELNAGQATYRPDQRRPVSFDAKYVRLATARRSPSDLRLLISDSRQSIEVGTCLSLEEREAIAPIIAAALANNREG